MKVLKSKTNTTYRRLDALLHQKLFILDQTQRWNVHLFWIPSHVGIVGSDIVDDAAKLAHDHLELCHFPLELHEIVGYL